MKTFIYQSDIYCESCGDDLVKDMTAADTEDTGDSDDFPQGPYRASEADSPQHCAHCRIFLENPLTGDGYEYVRKALDYTADIEDGDSEYTLSARLAAKLREMNRPVLAEWAAFYPEAFTTATGGVINWAESV